MNDGPPSTEVAELVAGANEAVTQANVSKDAGERLRLNTRALDLAQDALKLVEHGPLRIELGVHCAELALLVNAPELAKRMAAQVLEDAGKTPPPAALMARAQTAMELARNHRRQQQQTAHDARRLGRWLTKMPAKGPATVAVEERS